MKYDFDKIVKRRGTGSYKWDTVKEDGVIPAWVADMDFETAPCVAEAVKRRAAHAVYGYTLVDDEYYDAVIDWFGKRHGLDIKRDWLLYTQGVVPAVSCCIKAFCLPGEKVLVLTPVYNCFFSSIRNQGCQVEESELVRKGDSYEIDFDDFEKKCADEKTTLFLLCNPHNPGGRVWRRDELQRMGDICARHGVKVVSDEIHCEIVMPGYEYVPFASVNAECLNNSVTLTSPSKSFNTAGLQIANIICCNAEWRRKIDRVINIFEVCDVNPFGPVALKAAYSNEGAEWLKQLNKYIFDNYSELVKFVASEMPKLKVFKLEGTYLAWIDISATGLSSDEATSLLLEKGKLFVSSGTLYGARAGEGYVRLNLAMPRSVLRDALERMSHAFGSLACQ